MTEQQSMSDSHIQQTQRLISELNNQGITNLEELVRHVVDNTPKEDLAPSKGFIMCRVDFDSAQSLRPNLCFIMADS